MHSNFRRKCYMKGTQGGASLLELLKSLWGMINGRYKFGVMYMFPTTDDVHEFSKAILGPLLAANPISLGKWVKNAKGSTDTTSLKQVNGANMFMRGAGLTKVIETIAESSKMKGLTVDRLVFDEVELMDKNVIAKARGRLGNSDIKEEVYIGNPGVPGHGIDELMDKSDQRYWQRKCLSCGKYTCAELEFPNCIKVKDGKGYIACKHCGREVFTRNGVWEPEKKDNSEYMHGYNWSQLTSPNNDPYEILRDFENPPEGNLGDVYRLRLGRPFISSEEQLTTPEVFSCCGNNIQLNSHSGPCAFGLDVGKTKHLIIGAKTGRDKYEIYRVVRLSDWDDIYDMLMKFNIKMGVIDSRPYEDEARRFQSRLLKARVYLCEYSETSVIGSAYNNNTGIVKVNRTEICDATHELITSRGKLVIPRNCPEIEIFAKQLCDPYKIQEQNKKTKQMVYRYQGKEDHYRHALNYFLLAASSNKIGVVKSNSRYHKVTTVNNDYARV